MPENLRALPKIRDSLSTIYLAYGRLKQLKSGVVFENKSGRVAIPVANLCALLLGPGTSVTHRAVHTIGRSGCSMLWVGEEGVRFYAHGHGETRKGYALQKQAALVADPAKRMRVVARMYRMRFGEPLPSGLTLNEVRGREGARVRRAYRQAAAHYGIAWRGRQYDRFNWEESNPSNRALSAANACLNGVCHSAIVSAGYSAGLGFIHQGKQLSFVYDVADLYKTTLTLPLAFATASEGHGQLERVVRKRCRDGFRRIGLLSRIIPDIQKLLDLSTSVPIPDGFDVDHDPAAPSAWWEPPPEVDRTLTGDAIGSPRVSTNGTG